MHNRSHWEMGARESRVQGLTALYQTVQDQPETPEILFEKTKQQRHPKQKTGFLLRYPKEARRSSLMRHVKIEIIKKSSSENWHH